jgi:hypothetical protein
VCGAALRWNLENLGKRAQPARSMRNGQRRCCNGATAAAAPPLLQRPTANAVAAAQLLVSTGQQLRTSRDRAGPRSIRQGA